jgi:hypothetical protein
MPKRKLTEEEKKARREKMRLKEVFEHRDHALEESRKTCIKAIERGAVREPTYFFKRGDRVSLGNIHMIKVLKSFEGGKYYLIIRCHEEKAYGKRIGLKTNLDYELWTDLRPYRTLEERKAPERLEENDDIHFSYSQREVYSLLMAYYRNAGLDLNPDYQRGLVWTEEQKVALIDSMFKNIDIGKFTIIRRPFRENRKHYYEMLDGKQRLQAIMDFFECRFKYKGKTYNDLHWRDRLHIEHYTINWAETEPLTDEQKYRYFLKLNVSGVPMPEKHLDKVRKMWLAEKQKGK